MTKLTFEQSEFLEELYRKNFQVLLDYASANLPVDLATEVVQETFTLASEQVEKLMCHPKPMGWLVKTVKNKNKQWKRRYNNYVRCCVPLEKQFKDAASLDGDPAKRYEADLAKERVSEIKQILSRDEKYILRRIIGEHATHKQLAEELGITESACQKRFERIKKKARKHLEKKYGKIF